ncbi:FtsX-like permease family protein [Bifidobacterium moukalabense]|uniref:FtsX-like permease family protein n=1 Tax=Bifidobacterium moukalabense TaxID=1333651 RepID=UPI0010F68EB5|nr:ABC transporter permease [Bifidobacterium moukalabense]
MFVVKNAWQSVTRNKGRNILIIVIVTIIAAAATIGLSIRQAAATARNSGLENTTITAQISLDRNKLISESKSDSGDSDGKPDFDAMRSALADKQLSLSDYQKYAKASSSVKSTYYTETVGLAATDDFQPVTDSTSSSSSSASNDSGSSSDGNGQPQGNGGPGGDGGQPGGGDNGTTAVSGDFSLVGFSSDEAVSNAANGSFTMVDGKVFGYNESSDGNVIISKSLADFNNLSVGDTISVANPNDSGTTYKLTVVGIYKNSTDSNQAMGGPMASTASDPANAIYTSVSTLKSLGLDADSDSSGDSDSSTPTTQLNYTYVFASKSDYEAFAKDAKKAGLSSDYTVSSADVENYESSLVPLNNLSKFALTLLIVVLAVGGVVLVVITLLNVRERKYEIGVLTAIGVNKVKVAMQFTLELLIVTMIGLALGAGIGAAASVPVSNQLLSSQVEQQQSQQASQREQFGRDMQGAGADGASSSTDSQKEGSSKSTDSSKSDSGATGSSDSSDNAKQPQGGPGGMMDRAANYVSSINATVNLAVVGQLLLVGLGLTLIAALVAVVFVLRYEPLQILADRS